MATQTITSGSQSVTFTITSADTYILSFGETRTQTAGTGIQATVSTGTTKIDIEGTLNATVSGQRALRANIVNGQIVVGADGKIQALDGDAVQAQAANGLLDLTNFGQVISATTITTITSMGATPPAAAYALNYNAAVGATNAPSTDFTSGGTITNGSTTNTTALIRSDSGDAIRLGAHETLINYGTISGAGPINDSATNNAFNPPGGNNSTTNRYDISRGVRINASTSTNDKIDNFGRIEGSQHGVDVGNTAATNIQVVNEVGGTILGHNGSGIGADTTGATVGTVVVNNYGTIRGEYAPTYDRAGYATIDGDGDGVDVDGAATINNYANGLIAGSGANGNLTGQGAGGFDSNGRVNRSEGLSLGGGNVTNDGTISGADTAIVVNNDSNTSGNRSGVLATSIVNGASGSIIGQKGYAIRLENKTGSASVDNDTIVNAGSITGNGTIPSGTVLRQDGNADPGTVGTLDGVTYTAANAGSARFIQGDGSAIQTGEGADTLSNYGTITGNTGRAVNLEGGDDTLTLYTGSTVNGRLDGGAGTDTLVLRLDDLPGTAACGLGSLGANSGATSGSLANVVNFEALSLQSGSWTLQDAQSYTGGITFATLSGTATARLTLAVDAQATKVTFASTIINFGVGSQLDLAGLTGASISYNAGDGTITINGTRAGQGVFETFRMASPSSTAFTARDDGAGGTLITVCFATGTRIRTTRGDVAVEDLRVGDQAVTASGRPRPIVWIGHRVLGDGARRLHHDQAPVRVRANAFGSGVPARDLRLSPGHPVLVGADADNEGGLLVPIMCLVNGTSIAREPSTRVTYWHVELDTHDILLADGLPAESYLDWGDRAFFAEASDHALHDPDFAVPGLSGRCRAVAIDGPTVEAERRRLDARFATQLGAQGAWPLADIPVWLAG